MSDRSQPTPEERDERVMMPLDPEEAVRALLAVDPDSEPVQVSEAAVREQRDEKSS